MSLLSICSSMLSTSFSLKITFVDELLVDEPFLSMSLLWWTCCKSGLPMSPTRKLFLLMMLMKLSLLTSEVDVHLVVVTPFDGAMSDHRWQDVELWAPEVDNDKTVVDPPLKNSAENCCVKHLLLLWGYRCPLLMQLLVLHPSCWLVSQSEVGVDEIHHQDVNVDVVVEAFLNWVGQVAFDDVDVKDVVSLKWAQAGRWQPWCWW